MTKVNKLSRNIAIASMLAPVGASALAIGEIQLHSALNQNFSAEIPLITSAGEDTNGIRVNLASPAAFEKAGVERSYLLSALKFKPGLNADGTMSVKVLSNDAIREPYLNFLIEVNWPQGRMLKEYTVLLDPPSSIAQPVVTAKTAPQWSSENSRENSEPVSNPSDAESSYSGESVAAGNTVNGLRGALSNTQSNPNNRSASLSMSNDSIVVPKGAVLWNIADKMREQVGVSQEQMLIALFRANPDAFYKNNINSLKAGATLTFPEPAVLDSINEKESAQAVIKHNQRWNNALMSKASANKTAQLSTKSTETAENLKGRLKLTAPEGNESNANDQALLERLQNLLAQVDVMTEQNTSLKSQVSELEARIQELSSQTKDAAVDGKPVELQVAQTAEIDSANSDKQTTVGEPVGTVDKADKTNQVDDAVSEKPDMKAETVTPVITKVVTPVVTKVIDKPVIKKPIEPAQNRVQSESSFIADALESPWAIGSVLAALLLGLGGWLMSRRRQLTLKEEMALNDEKQELDNNVQEVDENLAEADLNQTAKQDSELGDSVFFSEYRPTEVNVDTQAMEVSDNDLDPISEADVYVAYGRYQQAEELIQQALAEYPDRDEYKLKLLEIYHAKDDNAGFTAYITELKEQGQTTSSDFWNRAEEIGAGFTSDDLFGGVASKNDANDKEVEEFSSELFGVDSQRESLELNLNDDLSAILADNASPANITNIEDVQSIDPGNAGETVDQLESAFALDELNSESMQIAGGENDSFAVNLTSLDNQVDSKMIDSENHIVSMLDDGNDNIDETSENLSTVGINFDAALTEGLDQESGLTMNSSVGKSDSFEFDSEAQTSSWDLDVESMSDVQLETEMPVDSEVMSMDAPVTEMSESFQTAELIEPMSSIDQELETSDSLGLMSTDDMSVDSVGVDLNDSKLTVDGTSELNLGDMETESISEDFQLITDASVMNDEEDESSYAVNNDSTMFHLDEVSSELVESAQISEILDEVSHRNTDFAEESVISELFEPASVLQESELFESELSDLDEVADKLDLAKAYIDMEDSDSARGILNEVIESGSDDQKETAKSMVQALEKSA